MKITIKDLIVSIEDFFFVETKDGEVKPFKLNNIQDSFINKIIKFKKENPDKPFRVMVLKGRQFGFSTLIIAWFLVKCLLVKNTRAVVVSHESEATKKLFRKVKFFLRTLIVPAETDKESEKAYSFPRTNSWFYIGTAGSKAFGRGDNITDLHCSEVAFWENPGVVMNGLLQAVGLTGNVIIETTANGMGNFFHKLWQKSYRNEHAAWLALFFKWTLFDEYELEPGNDFKRTLEEEQICRLNPEMNDRKLAWRRWKISETEAESGFTPEQIFMQEYPLTPQESFIHSGRAVFDLNALDAYKLKEHLKVEQLEGLVGEVFYYGDPTGYSVAGIDVAEGKENNDRHVLDIYNENLEQIVHLACWGDVDVFAYHCINIMNQYKSFCVPEVNGPGIKFMGYLKEGVYKDGELWVAKYNPGMIYRREEFDVRTKTKKEVFGWRTTVPTRHVLVTTLAQYVREHAIKINYPQTISEMMTFIRNKQGKPEAMEDENDDRVLAAGLAVIGYRDRPPKFSLLTPEKVQEKQIEGANREWRINKLKKAKKKQLRKNLYN